MDLLEVFLIVPTRDLVGERRHLDGLGVVHTLPEQFPKKEDGKVHCSFGGSYRKRTLEDKMEEEVVEVPLTAEEEEAYIEHLIAEYEEMISTEYYYALRGA